MDFHMFYESLVFTAINAHPSLNSVEGFKTWVRESISYANYVTMSLCTPKLQHIWRLTNDGKMDN